jgi:5'-3' exonuclease
MTVALVDGDLVAYRCAASAEQNEADIALIRASRTLQDIVSVTGAEEARVFLSGSNNFRYTLYPEYKANRKDMVRPRHLETVREYLVLEWSASVTDGYEADDAIGIQAGPDTTIVSLDKDFKQIPGSHYNFVTGQFDEVSVIDGYRSFYKQLLTGDRADNIPGITGIGKVRSSRIIDPMHDPCDMYGTVRRLYQNDEVLHRNGRLLYIWRQENDLWHPPLTSQGATLEVKQEEATLSDSTPMMLVETIQSTERGGMKQKKGGFQRRGQ